MTITVYKSDDVGAPLLAPVKHSLCDMLKAILVTGYGAKPGAGWTVGAEDAANGKIILSNSDGKHFWFLHDEFKTTNQTGAVSNFHFAFAKGVENFSAIDTHTANYPNMIGSVYPDMTSSALQGLTMCLSQSNSFGSGVPWLIIADDKAIHIFIQTYGWNRGTLAIDNIDFTQGIFGYSFGSFGLLNDSTDTNNGYVHGFSYTPTDSQYSGYYMFGYGTIPAASNSGKYLQRNYAGDPGAVESDVLIDHVRIPGTLTNVVGGNNDVTSTSTEHEYYYIPTPTNEIYMADLYLVEYRLANEHVSDPSNLEAIRGYLPGVFGLFHNINPASAGYIGEFGDTFTSEGKTYILACANYSSANYSVAIDITGPW